MELDDLLTRAAPRVAPRTDELLAELRAMARAAEPVSRRRRRVAVAGVVAAALLGTGVAAATGAGPLPGGWLTTSHGSQCRFEYFAVTPREVFPDGNPFTAEQQQAVADEANAWLASFDFDSIDEGQAIQEWQVAEAAARSGVAPDERQPKLHGDELEVQALNYAVWQRLAAHLTAAGLDPDAIDIGMGSRCD